MLFLLFQMGKDHYALDAGQVAEVLPLVSIKQIPQAPMGVAGAFDGAPYLGPVATDARGLIQWIEVHKLLLASLREVLFRQSAEV
jgi:chemotaxis signal transduction protein